VQQATAVSRKHSSGNDPRTDRSRRLGAPPIHSGSRVLALVPHYACEEWLAECLDSLMSQTRPLEGIVVLDDATGEPPAEITSQFPRVTLMKAQARKNVGPYRLVQAAIDSFSYDAYMFQDADDWSTDDRLERLLAGSEATGADLIGSQEVRVMCADGDVVEFTYPLDTNRALVESPTSFPLLHPTSLVSRRLVAKMGGFATGLRFAGDAEFLRRAGHAARVANVPDFCYCRRIRANSLTTASSTGMQSPARLALMQQLHARARRNAELAAAGESPNLTPVSVAAPIKLVHVTGPKMRSGRSLRTPVSASSRGSAK
jgi:hypothetical protein